MLCEVDEVVSHLLSRSMDEAQNYLRQIDDVAHDIGHGRRTAQNAVIIGHAMGYENLDVLALCGLWHDVGRLIDPPDHERISAEMARDSVKRLGADGELCSTVYRAIVNHKYSMVPETLEGHIVRDADKLDWLSCERWEACISVGQEEHLCTSASRLPQLYDYLKLAPSQRLYEARIEEFMSYIKTINIEKTPFHAYIQHFQVRPFATV
ncbi:HD domain-containing protein [soil metagenome]